MLKISVVLPCYNVEKYIRKGLESVRVQTMQEWEAILVDDGATDSTAKICDEYAEKDKRFRVIHTKNQGVPSARNEGIKVASGEMLYFMDPDDYIYPTCFERCYETFKQYNCDIVYIGSLWKEETREYEIKREASICEGVEVLKQYTGPMSGFSQEALEHHFKGNFIWDYYIPAPAWCMMYDRSFIEKNDLRYPIVKNCDDYLFSLATTSKAQRIVSIPDILYHYYLRNSGYSVQKKSIQRLFDDHYNRTDYRYKIRQSINSIDLQDYYIASDILSCLRLAIAMSESLYYLKDYLKFVTHPDVQECIKNVSIKNAPPRFAIPVRLLKMHCQSILFIGCWLLRKVGYHLPESL